MLVLGMNSKRQRRPNVRLGEIGDASAAFTSGPSQKTNKRWKHEHVNLKESECNSGNGFSMQKLSDITVSDPGVSPRVTVDLQQNRENKNPNSTKSGFELVSWDETDMTKSELNFGKITRKCRLMKRRVRGTGVNNSGFSSVWGSKLSPEFSNEDGKEYEGKEFSGFTLNEFCDLDPIDGFKSYSDHETSGMSKEACENDMNGPNLPQLNPSESWKEDACYEVHNGFPKSSGECDKMMVGGSNVNAVRGWLEEIGFGRYAGVFEMHEVDEEALLLLTVEDLKEMGVLSIGPRRKLYSAIQQLKEGAGAGGISA